MYRYIKTSEEVSNGDTLIEYSYYEFLDLFDKLDVLSSDNSSNHVDRVLTTRDFESDLKTLRKGNKSAYTKFEKIAKDLVDMKIPTDRSLYNAHTLKNSNYNELHIKDNVLLLYRYVSNVLIIDLELVSIGDHDHLNRNAQKYDDQIRKNSQTPRNVYEIDEESESLNLEQ